MTKLTHKDFIEMAITKLRAANRKGLNKSHKGLNEGFSKYFGLSVSQATDAISHTITGKEFHVATKKGNSIIYLANDAPVSGAGDLALAKMGLTV